MTPTSSSSSTTTSSSSERPEHPGRLVRGDGVDLFVREAGPVDAPVVVLVHGYPDTSAVWDGVVPQLADRFRVVTYDVRGMGRSSVPSPKRGGWHLDRLTADFLAVADDVSPDRPVHLVGHDWGSVQSWAFVADERAGRRIASFTSISGPSLDLVRPWIRRGLGSPTRARQAARQALSSGYVAFFQLPVIPELGVRASKGWAPALMLQTSGVADPSAHVAPTWAVDARNGLELYRQNGDRMATPRPIGPGTITAAVQLVVPSRDPYLTTALYEDLPALLPGMVRRDVAAGHWVPLTHAEVLARWIAEHVTVVEDGVDALRADRRRAYRAATTSPEDARRGRRSAGRTRFADRVVLVTGAGRGIGRATAVAFAEEGAEVVLVDLDEDALGRTAELALASGAPGAHVRRLDVTDRDGMEDLAAELERTIGVPDVVVNNAGVGAAGPFLATSAKEWDRIVAINLGGVANGCAAFGRRLVERGEGGHIVNVASAAAYLPSRATPVYGTTKAAVLALSENLRAELSADGIGVSAICPGIVDTGIVTRTTYAGVDDEEAMKRKMDAAYKRRAFPPEKVAAAIVDAVVRDRAVVPVTAEAKAGLLLSRLAPGLLRRFGRVDSIASIAKAGR
ncbi:MAG: SDR family oxidoreductase [Acidimicrobiales bacterium]